MGKRQQSDVSSKKNEAILMDLRNQKGELEARLKRVNEDLEPLMDMLSQLDIVTDRLSADAAMLRGDIEEVDKDIAGLKARMIGQGDE